MIRGLYTSGWSMLANSKKLDVITNNLANVNTNGFKKDTVVFQSFPELLTQRINDTQSPTNPNGVIGSMSFGSDVGEIFTYYTQGMLAETGNSLDMSIENADNAFFTIMAPDANGNNREFLTRNGSFKINAENFLVNSEGYNVIGQNGPITLEGDDFTVEADGTIIQNGQVVDRLLIQQFDDALMLGKYGNNLLENTQGVQVQAFTGSIRQNFLEQSNVNSVREMVDMIAVMRAYEANQKIIQAQDTTLDKAVNEVGIVR